jgi:hypothetical protein
MEGMIAKPGKLGKLHIRVRNKHSTPSRRKKL